MKKRVILAMVLLCAVIFVLMSGCGTSTTPTDNSGMDILNRLAEEWEREKAGNIHSYEDFNVWIDERRGNGLNFWDYGIGDTAWSNRHATTNEFSLLFGEAPQRLSLDLGYVTLFSETEYAIGQYAEMGDIMLIAFLPVDEAAEIATVMLENVLRDRVTGGFNMALFLNPQTGRMERILYEGQSSGVYPTDDGSDMMIVWRESACCYPELGKICARHFISVGN